MTVIVRLWRSDRRLRKSPARPGDTTIESQDHLSFAIWLAQRGLSHHTVRLYQHRAQQFVAFCTPDEHSLESAASDAVVWEERLQGFIVSLQQQRSLTASNLKQLRAALGYYRLYLQLSFQTTDEDKQRSPHAPQPHAAACRIELLGGLRVTVADRAIGRFASGKTGTLLAYLAFYRHRRHRREMLAEMLWPDVSSEIGRSRLKQCLSSLRRQLEPPGIPHGSILVASREEIGLQGQGTSTDVADFVEALRKAENASDQAERLAELERATTEYQGELLPDHDEPWIIAERERLMRSQLEALRQLTSAYEQAGNPVHALTFARRAIDVDPLCEECHGDVMRLLATMGQLSAVSQQYRKLRRLLTAELGTSPSAVTRESVRAYQQQAREIARNAIRQPFVPTTTQIDTPAKESDVKKSDVKKSDVKKSDVKESDVPAKPSLEHDRIPDRLPLSFTRFFGREQEIAVVREWLQAAETRLVTLTGPGGCGKTRLALEVARQSLGDFGDNDFGGAVYFIALADLNDARLITPFVAEVLGLRPSGHDDAIDQIEARLAYRSCLLVLDNFEHLVDSGAGMVRELLARVPGLTCLVTSRQRLELEAEREYSVAPLPVPDGLEAPESLAAVSSVQLFRDRAQALRPDFQITARNAAAMAALCRALEGLPLALELAATWIQTLTPYQMLERLQDRFRLLASQRKDIAPRHRTLWATVEASYRLLIPELQRFFTAVSIFRGGWTLAAAEEVCQEPKAAEYLAQLQVRSLVTATETPDGAEMRFRMLETLREYAWERQAPEERYAASARHLNYLLRFACEAEPKLNGPEGGAWLERLEGEQENLRAALQWTLGQPEPEMGLRLAGALWRFWYTRGNPNEGAGWLRDLLAIGKDTEVEVRLKGLNGAGNLAYRQADYATARTYFAEGLRLRQEMGDQSGGAVFLASLANIARDERNFGLARELLEQSLAVFRQLNNTRNIGLTLANLALVAHYEQNYADACDLHQQSLTIFREAGDKPNIAIALNNLVSLDLIMGELEQVGPLLQESLTYNEAVGNKHGFVHCLTNLVNFHLTQGRFDAGAVLIGAIEALCQKESIPLPPAAAEELDRHRAAVRAHLEAALFARTYAEGATMSLARTLAYARDTLDRL